MTFLPEPSESAAADRQSDGLTTDEARRRLEKIDPNATPRIGILTVRANAVVLRALRVRLLRIRSSIRCRVSWPPPRSGAAMNAPSSSS